MVEILITKSQKRLVLKENGSILKEFQIGIGKNENGHKYEEGDLKTPEGEYFVCVKNPKSKYHLSLGLNYPNNNDAREAYISKRIDIATFQSICMANDNGHIPPWNTCLGGAIYIHGDLETKDWSEGCIRLVKEDIEYIFEKASVGTKVVIEP